MAQKVCFICNLTPEETDGENGPMMSTLGGDACKTCAEEHGYRHPRDMIYLDAETFEAPKTMTKSQAKKKFVTLAQPYWIKELTELKQSFMSHSDSQSKIDAKDVGIYIKIAKSESQIRNIVGCDEGDSVVREMIPESFYYLINYDRDDYDTWERTADDFEGPKSIQKQLKALLPFIEGKVTVKPKDKPIMSGKGQQYVMKGTGRGVRKTPAKKTTTRKAKAKPKAKAKAGRKAPTISATKRKIGTRMRGNDGKMWEVKKSGKSQRWMAGAETFEAEDLRDSKKNAEWERSWLVKSYPHTITKEQHDEIIKLLDKHDPKANIFYVRYGDTMRIITPHGPLNASFLPTFSAESDPGAEGMDSEQDGYTFAYSQGHNDGRKNIGYNQQLSSGQEQKHFRKILSQRAESFDPADAWDNHIHQEEMALEAYEEYLEEVSEQDEPLSFEDWYEQTMAIYDTPEYDEYLEKQYLQMQEDAEELERQLKTLEAEGFNRKQGILWVDTEESDKDWDQEAALIESHLSSNGYSKIGSNQFFTDRKYAYVLYRLRSYLLDIPDKIKGYQGVVEDREYINHGNIMNKIVFSPWQNKAKNKVAIVWQFYDHHGFLVSEPYYKYFSLTNPPAWFKNKYELHIGEDYRFDKCPFCDYQNTMNSLTEARRLAAHIYGHGPVMNGSPFGSDFNIEVTPSGYGDEEKVFVDWGNPFDSCEILEKKIPYLYGMDTAEWWEPTAAQERKYNQKQKTIKAGLRAAGFKFKRN